MKNNRLWLVLFFLGFAVFLHISLHRYLFSFIPLSITLPFLIAWLWQKPLWYLIAWAAVAELLSTLPFGLVTLATFLPFLIHLALKKVSIDLSFSFLVLTTITIFLQTIVLTGYRIPLTLWVTSVGLTSLFGYSVCLIVEQFYPSHE